MKRGQSVTIPSFILFSFQPIISIGINIFLKFAHTIIILLSAGFFKGVALFLGDSGAKYDKIVKKKQTICY